MQWEEDWAHRTNWEQPLQPGEACLETRTSLAVEVGSLGTLPGPRTSWEGDLAVGGCSPTNRRVRLEEGSLVVSAVAAGSSSRGINWEDLEQGRHR